MIGENIYCSKESSKNSPLYFKKSLHDFWHKMLDIAAASLKNKFPIFFGYFLKIKCLDNLSDHTKATLLERTMDDVWYFSKDKIGITARYSLRNILQLLKKRFERGNDR